MKLLWLLILWLFTVTTAAEDEHPKVRSFDLDESELKLRYEHFVEQDFSLIAKELVSQMSLFPVTSGIKPSYDQTTPWKYGLPWTLYSAWQHHVQNINNNPVNADTLNVLVTVLISTENDKGTGRHNVLHELNNQLNRLKGTEQLLLEQTKVLKRLTAIVTSNMEPLSMRMAALRTLIIHEGINHHINQIIKLTTVNQSDSELKQVKAMSYLISASPVKTLSQLSQVNKNRYLYHAFELLNLNHDGKTGRGYFLALHLETFLSLEPAQHHVFKPDQSLKQYQTARGLSDDFFQQTVDNALQWWQGNHP